MTRTNSARFMSFFYIATAMAGMLTLFSVAMPAAGAMAATTNAAGTFLLKWGEWSGSVSATVFAAGSTLYCYFFLRARSIPVPLAALGVFGSALLVVALPLQMARLISDSVVAFLWIPIALFEVTAALWLLIKRVAVPQATR